MELILGIGLVALFGKKIIKTITNTIVFLSILVISLVLTFMYNIPYIISIAVCILVKYGLKDFIISIKDLSKSLIISKNRYDHGYIQKLVNILINCNYFVFTSLCYYFLVSELINPNLTTNQTNLIAISIIAVLGIRIFRKILDKTINKKLFSN